MSKMKLIGTATLADVSGVKVNCEARGKTFVLDEPAQLGGTDEGMNPIEALLSSLGACKCIVTKMVAGKMGIPLESVSVECTGLLDPEGFTGANPDAKIGLSEISSVFNIKSSASKEEIEKLVEFVDVNCPVNDTIQNSPSMSHSINYL